MKWKTIKRCKYIHGRSHVELRYISIDGNTEDAVRKYLQKRHPRDKIVIEVLEWK